jgi:type II secretory pathway component GspD/PulD (secretin)
MPIRRMIRAMLTHVLVAVALLAAGPKAQTKAAGKKPAVEASGCKKLPPKAQVKLNFKPDTDVADVIAWYANSFCVNMLVSSSTPLAGKKVTIISPTPVTAAEAQRLFFSALESVGLTVEPEGKGLRVIDAAKARGSPVPLVKP